MDFLNVIVENKFLKETDKDIIFGADQHNCSGCFFFAGQKKC